MVYFSAPTSSFGYYKGLAFGPYAGGQGSGQGVNMAGQGIFSQGSGPAASQTGWTPTILYLFALIIVEMAVFGFLSRKV